MTASGVLVSSWADGLFVLGGTGRGHELAGEPVAALAADGRGGAFAIVGGRSLRRRAPDGSWTIVATADCNLDCCTLAGDTVYVGTDDARILCLGPDGRLQPLHGFDAVDGRETWYAGAVRVNGQLLGPPLGVRSMSASADGNLLLANVHVGGIPRSTDGGATWRPTIDIETDVHEVRVHPKRPDIVAAAAALGLCISRDGGASWSVETEGLHAAYCSAVAFVGDDILVAAAADHFAAEGGVYRRAIDRPGALAALDGGFPEWLGGIADTACIAARGDAAAIADRSGNVYFSADAGRSWSSLASGLPTPSSVLIM